jgi:integral membrane protein
MLKTLRFVGVLEGISFLLLLGYAMPLKYYWDDPLAVQQIGMAHGVLWILYVALAGWGQLEGRWRMQTTAWLVMASLLPAGPFIADFKILSKKQA